MKKRLSFFTALVLIISVCVPYIRAAADNAYAPPKAPNTDYNFNIDWKFSKPYAATWPLGAAVAGTTDAARNFPCRSPMRAKRCL